ncbi:MAG: helicase [Candidatus Magasanikbacteria bacterium]|nr:helicase [Candidatus Magasanikbacteria bacterium]
MQYSLDKTTLKNHIADPEWFLRGENYWQPGRVRTVTVNEGSITGTVSGSTRQPYRVNIILHKQGNISSACSCPLGDACKHVAALGLAALEKYGDVLKPTAEIERLEQPEYIYDDEYERPKYTIIKPVARMLPVKEKTAVSLFDLTPEMTAIDRPVSAWKKITQEITANSGAARLTAQERLEIVVRLERVPEYSWDPMGKTDIVTQVRPRTLNIASGIRSMSNFSWKQCRYENAYQLQTLTPAARQFIRQLFVALYGTDTSSSDVAVWATIKNERAADVWSILKQHGRAGVNVVYQDETGDVLTTVSAAPLEAAIAITDRADGVTLSRQFSRAGVPSAAPAIVLGDPPVFALLPEVTGTARCCVLAGIIDHNAWATTATVATPLVVKTKNITELCQQYLPNWMRWCAINNVSQKLTLPTLGTPQARLAITRADEQAIELAWQWDYAGNNIHWRHPGEILVDPNGHTIIRDLEREAALERDFLPLTAPWKELTNTDGPGIAPTAQLHKIAAARFLESGVASAREAGVTVTLASDVPALALSTVEPTAAMRVTKEGDDPDWFNLRVEITVENERIALPVIITALASGEDCLFLPSGKYITLATPFFEKFKTLLRQAAKLPDPVTGELSLSRFQAGWFEEFKTLGIIERQARGWAESMEQLKTNANLPGTQTPPHFLATLRPYQEDGFRWLHFLRARHLGGVLADDMGLGKTIQSIALLVAAANEPSTAKKPVRPFLIIAPTSVVENWDAELERFAPHLTRVILRAGDRTKDHEAIATAAVVVTSYAILQRDADELQHQRWDTIILDEAQSVKNFQSKGYGVVRKLRADCRLALTGTPLENNLMELWSLFSICCPGLFPDPERFREVYSRRIEKENHTDTLKQLRARLRPFILRRNKDVVQAELPQKTEQVLTLDMEPPQRKIYDLFLEKERQRVLGLLSEGGLKAHRFEILTALLRLRQLCLHPGLVDAKYAQIPSVKIDTIVEQLQTIVAEKHKVLVFSQFTSFLALLRKALAAAKIPIQYLDGATRNRKDIVQSFQSDSGAPVFLISLKAGGVGLNLTAADYCFIADPWWNPTVEDQAIARSHRLGQTRPVVVYKCIIKNSIEEKILKLQEKKRQLFHNVLDDGAVFGTLITEEDIRGIFEC